MDKGKKGKIAIKASENNNKSVAELEFKISEADTKNKRLSINDINTSLANRRNLSSVIERSDKYKNIEEGISPFSTDSSGRISVEEAISLCQKAYYNIPIFRNVIELMVELSTNDIHYKGGNEKSRKFISSFLNNIIKISSLQDKFYREYYRSGNVFLYKHDVKLKAADITRITQTYGTVSKAAIELPIKYSILNPCDIRFFGSYSFNYGLYEKTLSSFEISALKSRKTEEDKNYYNSLPPEVKKQINNDESSILIPLDKNDVYSVFYKKQDYEPFSVPMGYGVLGDLSYKEELKKMDMALARTIQQVILLVTTGNEPDKGGVNQNHINSLNTLLQNQSIGRILVADYTTKAEFVIPQIADILDPKKYQIVNEDIQMGLHNILIGDEKFANQSIKVQIFIQKLRQARQAFLDDFLIPEIKRVCEVMGFKNYPTPFFEEFDLKNEVEFAKIYTRLAELGILTPDETIHAIETGVLPAKDASIENQKEFKKNKDDGLYWPIAQTGPKETAVGGGAGGRPSGTKSPQSTKKISPIGASLDNIIDSLKIASATENKLTNSLLKKYNLIELSKEQENIKQEILTSIICNEPKSKWIASVASYIKKPIDIQDNIKKDILAISEEYSIDFYNAAIIRASSNA